MHTPYSTAPEASVRDNAALDLRRIEANPVGVEGPGCAAGEGERLEGDWRSWRDGGEQRFAEQRRTEGEGSWESGSVLKRTSWRGSAGGAIRTCHERRPGVEEQR